MDKPLGPARWLLADFSSARQASRGIRCLEFFLFVLAAQCAALLGSVPYLELGVIKVQTYVINVLSRE